MSYQKIALLACRIIAVFIIANWLGNLSASLVAFFYQPFNLQNLIYGVVSMALPVVVGILLWVFSTRLAAYMVKPLERGEETPAVMVEPETVHALAFTIVGILLLVNALPNLVSALTTYSLLPEHAVARSLVEVISRVTDSAVRIILGLCLIFGSKGLAGLLKKIKTAGVK